MALPDWRDRRVWIFDMDGTLTVPVHDFAYARRTLGISPSDDILGALARRPPSERAAAERWLHAWERELADRATLQADAGALLSELTAAGCALGVLTRNTREVALRTLAAIGLDARFEAGAVLGRGCVAPKPHPAGIQAILDHFGECPERAVMVGDYLHDVRAGRAAGTGTVLVRRRHEEGWDGEADLLVDSLWPLPARLPRAPGPSLPTGALRN